MPRWWAWCTASAAVATSRRGRLGVGGVIGEPLVQARPADQLHAEVALAVVLADLVDRHDVRVVEPGDRLGLVLEPPQLVVGGQGGRRGSS